MEKSPDAFRTISEVADVLDTPAHVLRFWESRFPQIRPVKRAGGRRYYRPADVALLAGIKRLLHDEGMTIRGVQKILREQGVRHVSGAADGGPVVDAYDILGLAEAVAQADREDAAAKVIDLSTRVRASVGDEGTPGADPHADTDAIWAAADHQIDSVVQDALIEIEEAEIVSEITAGDTPVDAVASVEHPVVPEPDHELMPIDGHAALLPDTESTPTVFLGWVPTRLRTLPPDALDGHAGSIVSLAARLSNLRIRMAQPVRAGRG